MATASPSLAAFSNAALSPGAGHAALSAAPEETMACAIPHNTVSFFDRTHSGTTTTTTTRPLARRAGLPPSASPVSANPPSKPTRTDITTEYAAGARVYDTATVRLVADAQQQHARLCYAMHDFLQATAWANHDALRLHRPAPAPPRGVPQQMALVVVGGVDTDVSATDAAWLRPTGGVHLRLETDGYTHLLLSRADAVTAATCGWAESWSETIEDGGETSATAGLPLSCITVPPPRDAAELAAWKALVLASVRFSTYAPDGRNSIRRPERL
ncbi:hypothetical protein SPI_01436 [Niveomyces insectorum RCEF 264]|uniref:Uncharacterized protein n=1 Tax=Niveomyces insectorum RCEF 264 TaxID=1081102 RepID=A0A162MTU1_9HYPO|nr:hypothetical protein SPI_01436 [Niveomyces insectorum RCEF 264]